MKGLLVLSLLCLNLGMQSNAHLVADPDGDECIEELKLDKAVILGIIAQDYSPEDHDDYTNFMECYWKKRGFLDHQGNVEYDHIKAFLSTVYRQKFDTALSGRLLNAVASDCADIVGDSPGLKAIKMENCVAKSFKDVLTER